MIISMPKSPEQYDSRKWQERSYFYNMMSAAANANLTPEQREDLDTIADFGCGEWPELSDRTRSSISSTVIFTLDILNRGILKSLLCDGTTTSPEMCFDGKLFIMGMPLREWSDVGQIHQTIWKLSFMRAAERRNVTLNRRPVFLFADEAQNFLIPGHDAKFQATCRSQRVAVVLLSQNIPGYLTNLSNGPKGESEANALLACLNTHIFHCNGDSTTNDWAAERIGKCYQVLIHNNTPSDADIFAVMAGVGSHGSSTSANQVIDFDLQPSEFTRLRTGGPENDWLVDAIMFRTNRLFKSTGKTWLPITIRQHFAT